MNKTICFVAILVTFISFSFIQPTQAQECVDDDGDGTCIDIISPTSGTYSGGDTLSIQWRQKGVRLVTIDYNKCDSCYDRIVLSLEVDPSQEIQSYDWIIPEGIDSSNVVINIEGVSNVPGGGVDTDTSESFAITNGEVSIKDLVINTNGQITWTTELSSNSAVYINEDGNNLSPLDYIDNHKFAFTEDDYVTNHSVDVSGLETGKKYSSLIYSERENNVYNYFLKSFDTPDLNISRVKVEDIGYNEATISWYTNYTGSGSIQYGESTSYGNTVSNDNIEQGITYDMLLADRPMVRTWSKTISNLEPGTTYYYKLTNTVGLSSLVHVYSGGETESFSGSFVTNTNTDATSSSDDTVSDMENNQPSTNEDSQQSNLDLEVYTSVTTNLIKLANSPAIYMIGNDGNKRLFVNSPTFWSHYRGSWTNIKHNNQRINVATVSQDEFDSIRIGGNLTIKPGSKLIKFDNSPRIYIVYGGSRLKYVPNISTLRNRFSENWSDRLVTIQNSFETDYIKDNDGFIDTDNDGLSNDTEINIYNTDPNNNDSDGDGYMDGNEILFGYNPNNSGQ